VNGANPNDGGDLGARSLLGEPERHDFLEQIAGTERAFTIATAVFEAILAVCRQKQVAPVEAEAIVSALLAELRIEVSGFDPAMIPLAVEARQRFGSGKHRLNMGDCLSYAAARHHRAELLFKGEDFTHTEANARVAS
jgi:ribonuclease VapC